MANELAVVSENDKQIIMGVLGGGMAQDIEFNSLDSAIEKIADHTSDLSDMERNAAIEIVDKFEQRVISTINNKESNLSNFLYYMEHMAASDINVEYEGGRALRYRPQIELLLSREGMDDLEEQYQHIAQGIERLVEVQEDERPEEPLIDHNCMTGLQIHRLELEYQVAKSRFQSMITKEQYKLRKEYSKFLRAFKKNAEVKKFIKTLNEQADASKHAKAVVEEKAAAARLNILVGNADIREALKSFHDFASSIA